MDQQQIQNPISISSTEQIKPPHNHKILWILLSVFILLAIAGLLIFKEGVVSKISSQKVSEDNISIIDNQKKELEIISILKNKWPEVKVAVLLNQGEITNDKSKSTSELYEKIQQIDKYEGGGPNTGPNKVQFIGNNNLITEVEYQDGVYFSVLKFDGDKFSLLESRGGGNFVDQNYWNDLVNKYGNKSYPISTYSTQVLRNVGATTTPNGEYINFDKLTKVPENVFVENYSKKNDVNKINDISSWETYRNNEYGFEIKYPKDYILNWNEEKELNKAFLSISDGGNKFSLMFNWFGDSGTAESESKIINIMNRKIYRLTYTSTLAKDKYQVLATFCEYDCENFLPETEYTQVVLNLICPIVTKTLEEKNKCNDLFNNISSTFKFVDIIPENSPVTFDEFATCLGKKGATFFGAFWCPHCQSQKSRFGSSAKLLPYVECSTPDAVGQTQICKDKKINVYPTWEFVDGSRITGEVSIEELGLKTSCEIPAQ